VHLRSYSLAFYLIECVLLARSSVDLLEELGEFAGDVSGMAIQNWSVSSADLTGMVEDDDLSVERVAAFGWIVLGVTADIASSDFLDGDVLDVESNVVSGETLSQGFVVHFNAVR